ncbi:EAL domain-containing protein [Bacillus sp. FJAT-45066]|uniref:EAL domain-containing protein n=1 Tax=Bacillus sp. FJAT-45066 TaxID=2011010 RepID=UPI000BB6D7F2|nr:EAL domain-containing protein [Bacillus sp. FJAT-45066]
MFNTDIDYEAKKVELERILNNNLLAVQYQPIVSLVTGENFAYEALTRGPKNSSLYSPSELFPFALGEGSLYTLEKNARELALTQSAFLEKKQKLFINISADVIHDPKFTPGHTISVLKNTNLVPEDIVFEITERSAIKDFAAFREVLNHYREQGFLIAIDDAGAGYSSLQAISELQPDFIKVDRSLVSGIHQNEIKRNILEAFMTFAQKMKSKIIAEGIEEKEELETAMELDIQYAQGYFLGTPANPVQPITADAKHCMKHYKISKEVNKKSIIVSVEDEIIVVKGTRIVKRMDVKEVL